MWNYNNIRFSGRFNQQNIIRYDGVESGSIAGQTGNNAFATPTGLIRPATALFFPIQA